MSERASNPSEAIVLKITERTDVNPVDLPPLYERVDPEALDSLVQGPGSFYATFEYTGYEVTVSETGCIQQLPVSSERLFPLQTNVS